MGINILRCAVRLDVGDYVLVAPRMVAQNEHIVLYDVLLFIPTVRNE